MTEFFKNINPFTKYKERKNLQLKGNLMMNHFIEGLGWGMVLPEYKPLHLDETINLVGLEQLKDDETLLPQNTREDIHLTKFFSCINTIHQFSHLRLTELYAHLLFRDIEVIDELESKARITDMNHVFAAKAFPELNVIRIAYLGHRKVDESDW